MRVSVIIPVFNDSERLKSCLDSLSRQTYPRDQFEIIVVDNGSEESPRDLVNSYTQCRLLDESKPGSYAARNRGLKEARGDLIAFTDADCLPDPEWLTLGVAMLDDSETDVVGGDIQIFPARQDAPTAVELYDVAFGLPQKNNIRIHGRCMTANLITRRTVFDRIGTFDETVYGGGDHQWCNRLREDGGTVAFCPSAVVRHPARHRLNDLMRQARREVGGRFDRRMHSRARRSILHTTWMVGRVCLPNFAKMVRARSLLADRGFGLFAWLRVLPVILAIQYSKAWESLRKLCGAKSERQ